MFHFTAPAQRASVIQAQRAFTACAALVLLSATAAAQAAPAGTAAAPVARRRSNSRLQRIQRNIQDSYSHRWEIAGGGGFLRFRTGQNLQKISQINFFMAPSYHFSPKWAVVADLRGMYGNANIPNIYALNNSFSPQISEYTLTGNIQRRFIMREKYSVLAEAGVGVAMSKFGGDAKGLKSEDLGMWPDSNAKPAFTVSVIGDYNIYNNLALRVQPTYLGTTFGNTVQNNLGVELGVVYRFGRQK